MTRYLFQKADFVGNIFAIRRQLQNTEIDVRLLSYLTAPLV